MGTIQQVRLRSPLKATTYRHSHPVSETAVPYAEFKNAGFEIDFVTEKGNMPECDRKMLEVRTF